MSPGVRTFRLHIRAAWALSVLSLCFVSAETQHCLLVHSRCCGRAWGDSEHLVQSCIGVGAGAGEGRGGEGHSQPGGRVGLFAGSIYASAGVPPCDTPDRDTTRARAISALFLFHPCGWNRQQAVPFRVSHFIKCTSADVCLQGKLAEMSKKRTGLSSREGMKCLCVILRSSSITIWS